MTKGRNLYGPGFWKQGREWTPGSGGFRGGFCQYAGPAAYEPTPRWWGPCQFYPNYGFDQAWLDETPSEEEALLLKSQVRQLKIELEEMEKRLAELGKESE